MKAVGKNNYSRIIFDALHGEEKLDIAY